jgi:hypothetical protein
MLVRVDADSFHSVSKSHDQFAKIAVDAVLSVADLFKGTGQDRQFGIPNFVGHLGVREVLVHNNTTDKQRVLEGSTDLAVNLDP